jgi:predicted dehydrogenase
MDVGLRVGFLGGGLIATFHSKMLRNSPLPIIRAGVYDVDPNRAAESRWPSISQPHARCSPP